MTAHKLLNPQSHILTNRVSHVSHFRHQQARWQHLMKCSTTVDVPGEKLFFMPKMWKKNAVWLFWEMSSATICRQVSWRMWQICLYLCALMRPSQGEQGLGSWRSRESPLGCLQLWRGETREADGGKETRGDERTEWYHRLELSQVTKRVTESFGEHTHVLLRSHSHFKVHNFIIVC